MTSTFGALRDQMTDRAWVSRATGRFPPRSRRRYHTEPVTEAPARYVPRVTGHVPPERGRQSLPRRVRGHVRTTALHSPASRDPPEEVKHTGPAVLLRRILPAGHPLGPDGVRREFRCLSRPGTHARHTCSPACRAASAPRPDPCRQGACLLYHVGGYRRAPHPCRACCSSACR